jgi:hypothetical protein
VDLSRVWSRKIDRLGKVPRGGFDKMVVLLEEEGEGWRWSEEVKLEKFSVFVIFSLMSHVISHHFRPKHDKSFDLKPSF